MQVDGWIQEYHWKNINQYKCKYLSAVKKNTKNGFTPQCMFMSTNIMHVNIHFLDPELSRLLLRHKFSRSLWKERNWSLIITEI